MQKSFLLITPDEAVASYYKTVLEPSGFGIEWKKTPPANARGINIGSRPVVFDLQLPDALTGVADLKAYHPEAQLIVIPNGDPEKTRESVNKGASFTLPERMPDAGNLKEVFRKAYSVVASRDELERLRALTEDVVIAKSAPMKKVVKEMEALARSDQPLVLCGEPGTGRGLAARRIHQGGERAGMPFLKIARLEDLTDKVGKARGGTLYIKDFGQFTAEGVEAVGRLIKDREFTLAGAGPFQADVRIMAGVGRPEETALLAGIEFRLLNLPPLRERREDILPLAECFLEELSRFLKKGRKHFTKKAREALLERDFEKGNAGELKELVHRACFLTKGIGIGEKDLFGSEFLGKCSFKNFLEERLKGYLRKMAQIERSSLFDTVVQEVERSLIELALAETKGNKLRAAKALGMNRNTLRAKIKQLRIKDFKDGSPAGP